MNTIFYFIVYQLSRLPFFLLYIFSDFLFIILYRIIRYRRSVIITNLKNSFPEKSDKEILNICKKFYANFCDHLVETLKGFTISQKELDKRFTYSNLGIFDKIKLEKSDVMMMGGHIFNWEWFIGTVKFLPTKDTVAVYNKLKNPFWNNKINEMRSRFGTKVVEKNDVLRYMMKDHDVGETTYFFIADQSPHKHAIHYYTEFLNQRTPVFAGFEKIARRKNMGVVYCHTQKVKRGHYHITFVRIKPVDRKFAENEIIHQFFEHLEENIIEQPDNWLWSHKRWKHANL